MSAQILNRAALLALIFSATNLGSATAATIVTPDPATPPVPPAILDNDESAHLQKVRAQVLSANPDLEAEEEKLKAEHQSLITQKPAPDDTQKNAMFAEWKAYQKKMRAAMLKIDPSLKTIFTKLDNARAHGAPTPFQPAPATKSN